jgi:hypothetical protein
MPSAWSLVQRLARCARSEVDIPSTEELIREGQQWLEADNHKELVQPFSLFYITLSNIPHKVSGGRRGVLGSNQVQVTPRTIPRPADYDRDTDKPVTQGRGVEGGGEERCPRRTRPYSVSVVSSDINTFSLTFIVLQEGEQD